MYRLKNLLIPMPLMFYQFKVLCLSKPETQNWIRGQYENKIRRHSTPEKIFETFATINDEDNLFMSHEDLFKALCPYNYNDPEEEQEKFKSQSLYEFADVNKDGKISFYEYFIVNCLIQDSRKQLKQFFKKDPKDTNQKEISKEEMKQYFDNVNKKSAVKITQKSKMLPDSRKIQVLQEDLDQCLSELIDNLYVKHKKITIAKFAAIREELLKDTYLYQFKQLSNNKDTIDGEQFARNLIAYLDPTLVPKYFKKLKDVDLNKGKIKFEEFYIFNKFLQENEDKIQEQIEERGLITKNRLIKLISNYQKEIGLKTNDVQIDIFIKVIDINNDNKISGEEFKALVSERRSYIQNQTLQEKVQTQIQIIKDKAQKIYNIIIE